MTLAVSRIDQLNLTETRTWLIEELWLERACGLIGGQPKCCKTWLGLEMMLSIASGRPCLGTFAVPRPGPVLIYLAEDHPAQTHKRLAGLAARKNVSLDELPLYIILEPTLRLDDASERLRLGETIKAHSPRAVLLDPLVRMHSLDENSARDMAALLGYFRQLERTYETAVILTHHMTKRSSRRPGQGLRGSGDFHAFGDSNLYLSRTRETITCCVEHRHARSRPDFAFCLQAGDNPALELAETGNEKRPNLANIPERVLKCLSETPAGLTRSELRATLAVNNQKLGMALRQLNSTNSLVFKEGLYSLAGTTNPLS